MRLPTELHRIIAFPVPLLCAEPNLSGLTSGAGAVTTLRRWRAAWRRLHRTWRTAWQRHRADWRRRQRLAHAYRELQTLDARTLRDLGFDRSEIMSVVTEIAGDADPTRTRSLRALRGL
jgi:hypothetical protein